MSIAIQKLFVDEIHQLYTFILCEELHELWYIVQVHEVESESSDELKKASQDSTGFEVRICEFHFKVGGGHYPGRVVEDIAGGQLGVSSVTVSTYLKLRISSERALKRTLSDDTSVKSPSVKTWSSVTGGGGALCLSYPSGMSS